LAPARVLGDGRLDRDPGRDDPPAAALRRAPARGLLRLHAPAPTAAAPSGPGVDAARAAQHARPGARRAPRHDAGASRAGAADHPRRPHLPRVPRQVPPGTRARAPRAAAAHAELGAPPTPRAAAPAAGVTGEARAASFAW